MVDQWLVVDNPLYLGLDIGTSGVRGICINSESDIVAAATADVTATDRDSLRNPLTWKNRVIQVLAELDTLVGLSHVVSVSVDGQSGTVLLCDRQGQLFEDTSLLYNDAPSHTTVSKVTALLGHCPATLGRVFELWHKQHQPKGFHAVHQADWIAGLLCGHYDQSDENNALKMGYVPQTKTWGELTNSFDKTTLPFSTTALPAISPPAVFRGTTSTSLAQSAGFSPACQVVSGTTDGTAGFIAAAGLDNLSPGTAVTSLGTTLIIKSLSEQPIKSASSGVYSHKLFDVWIAGGASNSGAGILLDYFTPDQLEHLSKSIDPSIESPLDYYPLLVKGERFPVYDPDQLSRVEPRPVDDVEFLAGLFESIARIEKQAYETLDHLGAPYPVRVTTIGGGATNPVWRKIRERVLGVEVVTAKHPDAAYGSALIAQLGKTKSS